MREANKAITRNQVSQYETFHISLHREKHPVPTIDDLIADLNGATHFSILDLSSGYHQLELSPKSPFIPPFSTHVGLRRTLQAPTLWHQSSI